jgi:hypothetical protein
MICVFAGLFLLSTMRKKVFDNPQWTRGRCRPRQAAGVAGRWLCWFGAFLTPGLLAYTSTSHLLTGQVTFAYSPGQSLSAR